MPVWCSTSVKTYRCRYDSPPLLKSPDAVIISLCHYYLLMLLQSTAFIIYRGHFKCYFCPDYHILFSYSLLPGVLGFQEVQVNHQGPCHPERDRNRQREIEIDREREFIPHCCISAGTFTSWSWVLKLSKIPDQCTVPFHSLFCVSLCG